MGKQIVDIKFVCFVFLFIWSDFYSKGIFKNLRVSFPQWQTTPKENNARGVWVIGYSAASITVAIVGIGLKLRIGDPEWSDVLFRLEHNPQACSQFTLCASVVLHTPAAYRTIPDPALYKRYMCKTFEGTPETRNK